VRVPALLAVEEERVEGEKAAVTPEGAFSRVRVTVPSYPPVRVRLTVKLPFSPC
jgi:hypothetical protein